MSPKQIAAVTVKLRTSGVLQPRESLLSGALRLLNHQGLSTSEAARTLGMSRFQLGRFMSDNGFQRVVRWMHG